MIEKNSPHIFIAGQFPPPVNGFAYITQQMAAALAARYKTTLIDLAPHVPKDGLGYHARRLALTLQGLWPLIAGLRYKNRRFYMACEGGLGLIYTLVLCAGARVLSYPIHIHHHSFYYIETRHFLMTLLLRVLGKNATHIFLSPAMAQRFAERYRRPIKSLILSNSAFVEEAPPSVREWTATSPLTLGLLSNLNDEKGLSLFVETLRRALAQGLNVRGVLAGPPATEKDRHTIAAAQQELGDKLDYRGPVYGADKSAFFRSIDLFVFPTQYANEAQPTVVFEAMAHGVPIVSFDRGSIAEQVGSCGLVIPQGEDFVASALRWIDAQTINPKGLGQLRLDARAAFLNDRSAARQAVATLFDKTTQNL